MNDLDLKHLRPALRKAGHALGFSGLEKLRPALWLRGPEESQKIKVLRMGFSIVENVPTPCGIIFKLCTASQLPYGAKSTIWSTNTKILSVSVFSLLAHVGATRY